MTDNHFAACLRLATSSYIPDNEKLASILPVLGLPLK